MNKEQNNFNMQSMNYGDNSSNQGKSANKIGLVLGIIIGLLIIASIIFLLTSNKNTDTIIDTPTITDNKENELIPIKITEEYLNNLKETPVTSFDIREVDGGVQIYSFIGDEDIIVIPEEVDGKPVVEIGKAAFSNDEEIRAVKISDSVIVIEDSAFQNCFNMEIVIFGSSVKTVKRGAFNFCKSLETIKLNDGLESLGAISFTFTGFKEIEIPASVIEIDKAAFANSYEYTRVFIGEPGSAIEKYIQEYGENENFVFRQKIDNNP